MFLERFCLNNCKIVSTNYVEKEVPDRISWNRLCFLVVFLAKCLQTDNDLNQIFVILIFGLSSI